MNLEKQIKRKVLPLLGNIGTFGALTYTIYYAIFPDTIDYWMAFSFVMLLMGSIAGMLIIERFEKRGTNIIRYNGDDVKVVLQPAYLYSLIPWLLLFLLGMSFSYGFVASFFGFALMPTFFFILGLGNGMFDITQIASRKMLYLAIVPLSLSLLMAFVSGPYGFYKDPVWIYGSIYLLFYLLVINRIKIEEMLLMSKQVNIENKKQIRRRNDYLIIFFYGLYLIIFLFRNMFTRASDWLLRTMFNMLNWFLNIFAGLYKDIDVDPSEITQVPGVEEDFIPQIDPPMNPIVQTILIVIGALTVAMVVYVLVKNIIKLVKWLSEKTQDAVTGGKKEVKAVKDEEFEEIIEFLSDKKPQESKRWKPKYKYNLSDLKNLESYKEKVRYLYGYTLERLKHKNFQLNKGDTPEEIVQKFVTSEESNILSEGIFQEFTDEYIQVRYGDKDSHENIDYIDQQSKVIDQGINQVKTKKVDDKS